MRIIDCFLFYNEVKLLEMRLKELAGVVDAFVVVESMVTFTGKSKRLFFQENAAKFSGANIVHVVVDDTPDGMPWQREEYQRNQISCGLNHLDAAPSDLIHISDVDEIPDAGALRKLVCTRSQASYSLEQDLYYYNLGYRCSSIKWRKAKLMPMWRLREIGSVEQARYEDCAVLPRGGWHFSYFGSPEFIANKIGAFAHPEYDDPKYTAPHVVREKIREGRDLFERELHFESVEPKSNPYLPRHWQMLMGSEAWAPS